MGKGIGEKIINAEEHDEAVALLAGAAQHFTEALGAFLDGVMILRDSDISFIFPATGENKIVLELEIEEKIETRNNILDARGLSGLVDEHTIIRIVASAPTAAQPPSRTFLEIMGSRGRAE